MSVRTLTLRHGSRDYAIAIHPDGRVTVDDRELHAAVEASSGQVRIAGEPPVRAWVAVAGDTRWVFLDGRTFVFEAQRQRGGRRTSRHHESLTAPMPATVRQINVAVGDRVERGDVLVVLEAMKMELPVKAGAPGVVEAVNCREGELVQPGTVLIDLESPGDEA